MSTDIKHTGKIPFSGLTSSGMPSIYQRIKGSWVLNFDFSSRGGLSLLDKGVNRYKLALQNTLNFNWNKQGGVDFNGTDEFAFLDVSSSFNADAQGTIGAWIKIGTVVVDAQIFTSSYDGDTNSHISLGVESSNGKLRLQIRRDGGTEQNVVEFGASALPTGEWCYVEACSDGSNYFGYVNGVSQSLTFIAGSDNGDWFASLATATNNIAIGALKRTTTTGYFPGSIARVDYFNKCLGTVHSPAKFQFEKGLFNV